MRSVLITGAGIGIGRGIATAFAALGDHVVLTDVLEAEGAAAAAELRASGASAEFMRLDVTSTSDANRAVLAVEAARGPLDIIVANAGIAHKIPLQSMTDELWHRTLDIDLTGMIRVVRAAATRMKAARQGSVICVKGLAIDLAPAGIRVNGIAPGLIRTAQTLDPVNSVGAAGLEAMTPRIPLGRVGEPRDIADVVTFLASDQARYITGQIITVDGGLLVAL